MSMDKGNHPKTSNGNSILINNKWVKGRWDEKLFFMVYSGPMIKTQNALWSGDQVLCRNSKGSTQIHKIAYFSLSTVYIYTCEYMLVYICLCIYVSTCARVCLPEYIFLNVNTFLYIPGYICLCIYNYECKPVYICRCVYACACVCLLLYISLFTYSCVDMPVYICLCIYSCVYSPLYICLCIFTCEYMPV